MSGEAQRGEQAGAVAGGHGKKAAEGQASEGVFVYGSLLSSEVMLALLQRVPSAVPATLSDYRACCVKGEIYPAVQAHAGGRVEGAVLTTLSPLERALLDFFEDLPDQPEPSANGNGGANGNNGDQEEHRGEGDGEGWGYKRVQLRVCVESDGGVLRKSHGGGVLPEREWKGGVGDVVVVDAYVWRGAREDVDVESEGWVLANLFRDRAAFGTFVQGAKQYRREFTQGPKGLKMIRAQWISQGIMQDTPHADEHSVTDEPIRVLDPVLLPQNFVAYTVCTEFGRVLRRYSDFVALHKQLTLMAVPPPLPSKFYMPRFDPSFIETRRATLELWINHTAHHPVFSQSEAMHLFLRDRVGKDGKGLIKSRTWNVEEPSSSRPLRDADDEAEAPHSDAMVTFCNVRMSDGEEMHPISALQLTDRAVSVFLAPTEQHASFPLSASCVLGAISMSSTVCLYAAVRVPRTHFRKIQHFSFQCHTPAQAVTLASLFVLLSRGLSVHSDNLGMSLVASTPSVLVLINPVAGRGKGVEAYRTQVYPLLRVAGVEVDEFMSQRPKDITKYIANPSLPLRMYTRVLVVGGDGTLFEYVQGLFARPDAFSSRLHAIPVAIIPTGSGNALALSVGSIDVPTAVHTALRGAPMGLDVAAVTHADQVLYSVLSLTWGLVADSDVGTDSLRWMGDARFTFGALRGIAKRKTVKGRVHFLPAAAAGAAVEGGEGRQADVGKERAVVEFARVPSVFKRDANGALVFAEEEGWQCVEGDFVLFVVCNAPFLGADALIAPSAKLDDGALDMIFVVNEVPSRTRLAELLMKMGDGEHVDDPLVTHKRVVAFHLEPLDASSHLVVDGEAIPVGPVSFEQHRGVCRIARAGKRAKKKKPKSDQ